MLEPGRNARRSAVEGAAALHGGGAEVALRQRAARHTQITGYSMGGYAAYKLGLAHPDLFAGAMSLAGPPVCGRVARRGPAREPGVRARSHDVVRTGPVP